MLKFIDESSLYRFNPILINKKIGEIQFYFKHGKNNHHETIPLKLQFFPQAENWKLVQTTIVLQLVFLSSAWQRIWLRPFFPERIKSAFLAFNCSILQKLVVIVQKFFLCSNIFLRSNIFVNVPFKYSVGNNLSCVFSRVF